MMRPIIAGSFAFCLLAAPSPAQDEEERPLFSIEEVAFEHSFGEGTPPAPEITLAALRGTVLVLEFWATW